MYQKPISVNMEKDTTTSNIVVSFKINLDLKICRKGYFQFSCR